MQNFHFDDSFSRSRILSLVRYGKRFDTNTPEEHILEALAFRLRWNLNLLMAQWVDMKVLESISHASLSWFFDSLGAVRRISSHDQPQVRWSHTEMRSACDFLSFHVNPLSPLEGYSRQKHFNRHILSKLSKCPNFIVTKDKIKDAKAKDFRLQYFRKGTLITSGQDPLRKLIFVKNGSCQVMRKMANTLTDQR